MSFTLHRVNDAKSFDFLNRANKTDNGTIITLFGMVAAFHVYDALTTFSADLILEVPDMPANPYEYGFILTSKGRRMFAYVVVRKEADYRAVNIFEVTPFVLLMPARGLRTISDGTDDKFQSRIFAMEPLMDVMAPDDGLQINSVVIDPEARAYFGLREGVPDDAPWVIKQTSSKDVFNTQAVQLPKTAPLYFELGTDLFQPMRINGDDALVSLCMSGGLLND
jgi:hypothetical protein